MIEGLKKIKVLIDGNPNLKFINSKLENDNLICLSNVSDLIENISQLKKHKDFKFRQLCEILAVDFPNKEKRFEVIYLLLSHEKNLRINVKVLIQENEKIPSLTSVYPSANWLEREVFDMFGVTFENHPDLRRILTDYNFEGYPLRKDFPLTGYKEVRYDSESRKVIYEPVRLQQAYRDFDFKSPWQGPDYIKEELNKIKK
jgi:NADH-quinone oxidoreductase subunit C